MAIKNGRYLKKIKLEIESISPFIIGGNDGEPLIDIENDEVYFPGTMVAGAFRSYLNINGFQNINEMFGSDKDDKEGRLSKVFIYDSYSKILGKEIRPGVRIDGFSGAAVPNGKFERKYLCEGHKFIINIEIYNDDSDKIKEFEDGIYSCITAIENSNITFGSYKTGGAGVFKVNYVKQADYDFAEKSDLFAYLKDTKSYVNKDMNAIKHKSVYNNAFVEYELEGEIRTPLLVKGIAALDYNRADGEQYQSYNGDYIIPGTSLKGIIRSQAERILGYYKKIDDIEKIFGSSQNEKASSRFTVYDTKIENAKKIAYSKIKIDRFTGGVLKGAKASEEPVIGKVMIKGKLKKDKNNKDEAIGLIALIFRDIANGELPIGSGSSIGRGRIKGKCLKIYSGDDILFKWDISQKDAQINKIDDYISELSYKEE